MMDGDGDEICAMMRASLNCLHTGIHGTMRRGLSRAQATGRVCGVSLWLVVFVMLAGSVLAWSFFRASQQVRACGELK
jgi:hypothetical protein